MINIEELTIGALVYHEGQLRKVLAIDGFTTSCFNVLVEKVSQDTTSKLENSHYPVKSEDLEPILMTKEWAEKIGLGLLNEREDYDDYDLYRYGTITHFKESNNWALCGLSLLYVHQIQTIKSLLKFYDNL